MELEGGLTLKASVQLENIDEPQAAEEIGRDSQSVREATGQRARQNTKTTNAVEP
jgi:hypothetical protein